MLRIGRRRALRATVVPVRSAEPIPAVHDEIRLDSRFGDRPLRDRVVDALDRVIAELHRELALRVRRPREEHEAARVPVEAVNDTESRITASFLGAAKKYSRVFGEGLLVALFVGHARY